MHVGSGPNRQEVESRSLSCHFVISPACLSWQKPYKYELVLRAIFEWAAGRRTAPADCGANGYVHPRTSNKDSNASPGMEQMPGVDVPSVEMLFKSPERLATKKKSGKKPLWKTSATLTPRRGRSAYSQSPRPTKTPKPKPEWNGYLTDASKYAIPKDRVLVQRAARLSSNHMTHYATPTKSPKPLRKGSLKEQPLEVDSPVKPNENFEAGDDALGLLDESNDDLVENAVDVMQRNLEATLLKTPGTNPSADPTKRSPRPLVRSKSPAHTRSPPQPWGITTKQNVGKKSPAPHRLASPRHYSTPIPSPHRSDAMAKTRRSKSTAKRQDGSGNLTATDDTAVEDQLSGALQKLEAKLAAVDGVVAEEKEKRLALEARLMATERELTDARALLEQQHSEKAAAASNARSNREASDGVLVKEAAKEHDDKVNDQDDATFAMSLYRSGVASGSWGGAAAAVDGVSSYPAVCEGTFDGPTDDGAAWGLDSGSGGEEQSDYSHPGIELRAESAFMPYKPSSHGVTPELIQSNDNSEVPRPALLPVDEPPTLWQIRAVPPPAPEGMPSHPMEAMKPPVGSFSTIPDCPTSENLGESYEVPTPRQAHGRVDSHSSVHLPEPRLLGEWCAPSSRV